MKYIKLIVAVVVLVTACKTAKYPNLKNGLYADIQTNKGDILVKLHAKKVPMTVANFVSLAEGTNPKLPDSLKGKKFYDKITFHRVIKNFIIQSGDPTGTGYGGSGYMFPDEFAIDSVGGLLFKHDSPGILSMANSGPNSNSSQFFITREPTPWLDGKHSVFGKVQIGQAVVDSIQQKDTINTIEIIRVGRDAKKFNAPEVFKTELANYSAKQKERLQKIEAMKKQFQEKMGIAKATESHTGLKVLSLKEGKGKKFNRLLPASMNYSVYLATGKLIQTTEDNKPYTFVLQKQPMISGVTEAILTMKEGDKKRLFIPYYLGYGEKPYGPFPAKSDIVFDIELVKVGK
ncbi:peptidylprolyl isomerase [Tenacibaculum sp. UWU-22]|uniref:peptidylprolyl isomerase n=1 Tax=Tenacibaculum sp. UWU-22 TaxID=3234187 RepID=UPI0034DB505E